MSPEEFDALLSELQDNALSIVMHTFVWIVILVNALLILLIWRLAK